MRLALLCSLLGFATLPLAAQPADNLPEAADPSTPVTAYPLRGVVKDVTAGRGEVLVDHEAIPGVMPAMTMLLRAAPAELESVNLGNIITATLFQAEDGEWTLRDIAVFAPPPDSPQPDSLPPP